MNSLSGRGQNETWTLPLATNSVKMSSMFSAAAALFARTNISQNYTILTPGATVTNPANSGLPSLPAGPPFKAGLWLVQAAQHKLNGKRVSVWTFEKRSPELERLGGGNQAKEVVLEMLKSEVSLLSKYPYVVLMCISFCLVNRHLHLDD